MNHERLRPKCREVGPIASAKSSAAPGRIETPDRTETPDRIAAMAADSAPDFPEQGRLAAIDYGTVRMGIAICDPERILASPLEVRQVAGRQADGDYFAELAHRERVAAFVVGLPIHCDGGESQKSIETREFAKWLADKTGRPVRLFDERFTTAAAQARLRPASFGRRRQKKRLDAVAALILLESFLEAIRYRDSLPGQSVEETPRGDQPLG